MLILCSARLLAFESLIIFNHFRMRSNKKRETMPSFCNRLQLFLKRKFNGACYDKEASTQKESTIKMFAPPHAELSVEKGRKQETRRW